DGHWLELAGAANARAQELAAAIQASGKGRLVTAPAGNEVFVVMAEATVARLKAAGAVFYGWPTATWRKGEEPRSGETTIRLVTSWQTPSPDIAAFAAALRTA